MRQATAAYGAHEPGPLRVRRFLASPSPAVVVALVAAAALVALAVDALSGRGGELAPPPPPPALVEGGVPTSFGAIAVGEVTRTRRDVMKHDGSGHAVQRVWTTRLHVELTIQNRLDRPVLYSPGQLRLNVHPLQTTAAPLRTGPVPDALPARSAIRTWVTYLAPEGVRRLSLEFSDVGTGHAIDIALPAAPNVAHVHEEGSR